MQSVPDHSDEWLSRLEQHTKGDPDLRLQYLEWMRTQKPKQQIRVQLPPKWLDQADKADFRDPLVASNFRRSLFSREVDYLEIALDEDSEDILLVLPEPGALPIYTYPVAEFRETFIADEGLQMHPAFLSLSILGNHSTDPEIPKLVLPVGRLVSAKTLEIFRAGQELESHPILRDFDEEFSQFSESPTQENLDNYSEGLRRQFWNRMKESNVLKDTDYFVVIDVVTPGYPVWIIYNPARGEDSADLTVTDLLQSTSKFPQFDSEPVFGAARILTGVKNWQSSYAREGSFWGTRHSWPTYFLPSPTTGYLTWTFDTIKANILQTRIQHPVVGRLENMKTAEEVLFKAQTLRKDTEMAVPG